MNRRVRIRLCGETLKALQTPSNPMAAARRAFEQSLGGQASPTSATVPAAAAGQQGMAPAERGAAPQPPPPAETHRHHAGAHRAAAAKASGRGDLQAMVAHQRASEAHQRAALLHGAEHSPAGRAEHHSNLAEEATRAARQADPDFAPEQAAKMMPAAGAAG